MVKASVSIHRDDGIDDVEVHRARDVGLADAFDQEALALAELAGPEVVGEDRADRIGEHNLDAVVLVFQVPPDARDGAARRPYNKMGHLTASLLKDLCNKPRNARGGGVRGSAGQRFGQRTAEDGGLGAQAVGGDKGGGARTRNTGFLPGPVE